MVKSLLPIGLLLLILLPGCSKTHSPQPGLIGQWRFESVVSVIPQTATDYAIGEVLELRPDSTYKIIFLQSLVESGTFSTSVYNAGTTPTSFITFKPAGNNNIYRRVMQLDGLKLYLKGVDITEVYQKQ